MALLQKRNNIIYRKYTAQSTCCAVSMRILFCSNLEPVGQLMPIFSTKLHLSQHATRRQTDRKGHGCRYVGTTMCATSFINFTLSSAHMKA